MTDNEKSEKGGGGPQAMLRGLLVVAVLAVVVVIGVVLYTKGKDIVKSPDGPQQVAMLDQEAIYAMPEFKSAKDNLEKLSNDLQKQLVEKVGDAGKPKMSMEEAENLRLQMREKLEQEQTKQLKPLYDRVTAAIAYLAVERGYRVVLDKKIVVTGVVDVTDEVKKRFQESKDATMPKEAPEAESHVGYVNQEVIAQLRLYKEAQARLMEYYQSQMKDVAEQAKKKALSQEDRERLQQELMQAFQVKQAEEFKPVNDKVNEAITAVAKEKGLSLVLNNTHVMWGGRNLTDDVIKKLVNNPPAKS
ncbi:MAG: OmpH family outer membrane protein [Armatimonadetes bacterium]|nr:OmpH family outer membrane protein [Armatimonadota bacterium]